MILSFFLLLSNADCVCFVSFCSFFFLFEFIPFSFYRFEALKARLEDIYSYLESVTSGKFPVNNQILSLLQDVFNLLPNLKLDELVKAFSVKTNDQMLVLYLASMIRSVIALHNLVNNKITNMEAERKQEQGADSNKDEKKGNEKEKKERKDSKSDAKTKDDKMDID